MNMYTGMYCALMLGHFDSISLKYFNQTQIVNISTTLRLTKTLVLRTF